MNPMAAGKQPMPLIDLQAQRLRLGASMNDAIARVVAAGHYIMGPEVHELEAELSRRSSPADAVTCSDGTAALVLALRALGLGPGDAVVVPSFTFAATAESVALVGATPVFADVDQTSMNLDPESCAETLRMIDNLSGLRAAAVMCVDLFGQPADYAALVSLCAGWDIPLIVDAAQGFGARWHGTPTTAMGRIATTSFFPAKPLGCFGDGGSVFTSDAGLATTLRSLRVHGQGMNKYDNVRVGVNSRLDTIQAAVLLQKLQLFDDELIRRQQVADRYAGLLEGHVGVPRTAEGCVSAWAQYTITTTARNRVAAALAEDGIATAIYYKVPLHLQPAYFRFPRSPGGLHSAEALAREVLSLPMHPYLRLEDQQRVARVVIDAVSAESPTGELRSGVVH